MSDLRQQFIRSLAIEGLKPVLVKPRLPDQRYWSLHQKCAAGTITPGEIAELDAMQAAKERGE